MKNWLFLALFLVLTSIACGKRSEPGKIELKISLPAPENQETKQGFFEETGKKMDQGIQKTGENIGQGLETTGEQIQKDLNRVGEKVKDATNSEGSLH